MKANNGKELLRPYDICKQHKKAIEVSDHIDLETFIIIAMELKLDEVMRLNWMDHNNDSQKTPLYSELLKFLDMQAWYFDSVTSKSKPHMTKHRSYEATVKRVCVACERG